jgi:Icc-related predicted phosphoesterase
MPGNDDDAFVAEAIATSSYVINPEGRVVDVGGLPMISVGVSNKTPWNSPREVSEEEMAALIEHLVREVRDVRRCLFNVHVPPFGTAIDQAPVLDVTLKPVVAGGAVQMGPVGSTAVRAAIERHQPLIGLHGHVHEARGAVKIGKTVCVNPGSQYGDGILDAFLVRVNAHKGLRSYQYVSG